MRLNKYISSCGVCSRREADKLIAEGRITVNGELPSPGQDVSETDTVCLDGKEIVLKRDVLELFLPPAQLLTVLF